MRNLSVTELGQVNGSGVPGDGLYLLAASLQIASYTSNPYVILGVGVGIIGVSYISWCALS